MTLSTLIPPAAPATALHHTLPAVAVHIALRREFRLAGPLVRDVEPGDTRRAVVVGDHVELLLRGLHHHHSLEDDLIWPRLRDRIPPDVAPVVNVMEDQHRYIERLVGTIARLLPIWSTNAGLVARDRVADALGELCALLVVHLDLEEQVVLPLAEEHLTTAEWQEVARRAEEGQPRGDRAVSFGMLQYEGDPAVLTSMLAQAPLPVRHLVPKLARRAYRRHALAVHGTVTP